MADVRQHTTITVNGQTYRSVDEMPPDVRRQYEQVMSLMADRNENGVPDILEGAPPGESTVVSQVTTSTADFKLGPGGVWERQATATPQPTARSTIRHLSEPTRSGGITIHFTWSTLLALLVVGVIGLVVWWVARSSG